MGLIVLACSILFGALFNRIRGGLLAQYKIPKGKLINVLAFTVFCFILFPWYAAIAAGLAMLIGQQPEVGPLVGSDGILGGKHDVAHLGKVSQRGTWWAALISLAIWSPIPLVAGLLYPVPFLIGYWFEQRNSKYNGWGIAEYIFGAMLWVSVAIVYLY